MFPEVKTCVATLDVHVSFTCCCVECCNTCLNSSQVSCVALTYIFNPCYHYYKAKTADFTLFHSD